MKINISLFLVATALSFNLLAAPNNDFLAGKSLYNQNKTSEALAVFITAAKAGSIDAQNQVGTMYAKGIGTDINYDHALIWYRAAARNNSPEALYNIGKLYQQGLGVEQDSRTAVQWYNRALEFNSPDAANNLADMYLEGIVVPQDHKKAEQLFIQASELGSTMAQRNLGFLYFNNSGIKQDIDKSYFWFAIAAANDYPDAAQYRDFIASKLTKKRLLKIEQQVSEWIKTNENNQENVHTDVNQSDV
ncbi:MAG: sel1 repeat family protein [Aliivibrio sp.]|uniref:tetratricopeptide repeat protein n=1 Tax=Aliivibrio sp. TaxID=1872443 RepID=UPI001A4C3023|nr:sel1 repeat family protein [Aliivibrio sp.]